MSAARPAAAESESALDTLKLTVQLVDNLIGVAQDELAGAGIEHDHAQEILDSARAELWRALGVQVDGVRPEHPHYTIRGRMRALTYDDGSPVQESIELRDGSIATYSPRRDGERAAFIEAMSTGLRARLEIVRDV